MVRRKAQDHFPTFMSGKRFLFYGLKHEKRERILFPIIAEFLFPQLIDLNTQIQAKAQWIVSLRGKDLQVSKTIML